MLDLPRSVIETGVSVSVNPVTGEHVGEYPWIDTFELEQRIARADFAFHSWRAAGSADRSAALRRLAVVLEERSEVLARMITLEMGKPLALARSEVDKCASLCRWYADNAATLLKDEQIDVGGDGWAIVRYKPLGVVLGVMPWNFPLWQVLRAAVPILAAGNSFVLKHADNVQGVAIALEEAFEAAGFPRGLFTNLNLHHRTIPAILGDPRIVGVTVTAGASAGSAIAAEAGCNLKKSVLELGGSDPFIVLADADLDRVVPAAIEARFQNSGQVCIAAKRLIVEAPVAKEFTRLFVAAAQALRVGDPLNPAVDLGPLARVRLRDELHGQVERSIAMGAELLTGGTFPDGPGAFYFPTVLGGVTTDMPVFREETFGPVAAIVVAPDAKAAVEIANTSEFGLSGSIWSRDRVRAEELAFMINSGGLFVNGVPASDPRVPIGGIGRSGYGRELSHFGMREFCNAQLVWSRA